jgi:ATP-binding cassette, subfamily B, bacterial
MSESPTKLSSQRPGKLKITRLIRPHWKALTLAFIAVLGETFSDVLEPWPIKIVIDNILQSKELPGWMGRFVTGTFGHDKVAILNFAVAAVAIIAVVGAVSSYIEKYLTTSVSQWVTQGSGPGLPGALGSS